MKPSRPNHWKPTRELLAAYADGELDRRPEWAKLRHQVEAWLAVHLEDLAEVEAQIDLSRLMAETTPLEPDPTIWSRVWWKIEQGPSRSKKRWPAAVSLAGLATASAAAALLIVMLQRSIESPAFRVQPVTPAAQVAARDPEPAEVFMVVSADEVEILQVAGADTGTLVVGNLPVAAPLVLLQPHEVAIQTPVAGECRIEIRMGSGSTPMAWTPLPGDEEESRP